MKTNKKVGDTVFFNPYRKGMNSELASRYYGISAGEYTITAISDYSIVLNNSYTVFKKDLED